MCIWHVLIFSCLAIGIVNIDFIFFVFFFLKTYIIDSAYPPEPTWPSLFGLVQIFHETGPNPTCENFLLEIFVFKKETN